MHLMAALVRKARECATHVPIQCKRATRKPPPVYLSGHQNLCSTLNTTFERLLLPTRSTTKRMFAELSPSSELLLSPISAPAPKLSLVVVAIVRSQSVLSARM